MRSLAVAAVAGLAMCASLGRAAAEPAPGGAVTPDVVVTAAPRWGPSQADRWTPYLITVKNDGPGTIAGEVVLVADEGAVPDRPSPAAALSAALQFGATPPPAPRVAFAWAIGNTEVTDPRVSEPAPPPDPAAYPRYVTPIKVAAGSEKTITTVVLQAPYGYHAELRDGHGRQLATPSAKQNPRDGRAVLLLSNVLDARGRLPVGDVTQIARPREVPDDVLLLSGVQAMVLDNFDTAALTPRQLTALRQFVALGGDLVVAGGLAGRRTMASLPEPLIPLRPHDVTQTSMSALAELAGQTTPTTALVVTGDQLGGRVVLRSQDGLPLVVNRPYGAGRVLQLTYDPLAEPLSSQRSLGDIGWNQGLLRAAYPWGYADIPYRSALAPMDQLWSPMLQPRGWPAPSGWALAAVAGYALLGAPLVLVALQRRRSAAMAWIVLAVVAVAFAGLAAVRASVGGRTSHVEVVVDTAGPDGTVMTNTYRATRDVEPAPIGAFGLAGVTTTFAEPGAIRPVLVEEVRPGGPEARGAGGGSVTQSPGGFEVRTTAQPWQARTVQTVAFDQRAGGLDAHLRITGTSRSPGEGARVSGTVTNHGSRPVRDLRAQLPEGAQARLTKELAPGAAITVDAPLVKAVPRGGGSALRAPPPDLLLFAAASRAFTRPGQIALVGLGQPSPPSGSALGPTEPAFAVTVAVVALEGAEERVAYAGSGQMVSSEQAADGTWVDAYDFNALAGSAPMMIAFDPNPQVPQCEVYDWQSGGWRTISTIVGTPVSVSSYVSTLLRPSEVNDGLVRVRAVELVPQMLFRAFVSAVAVG